MRKGTNHGFYSRAIEVRQRPDSGFFPQTETPKPKNRGFWSRLGAAPCWNRPSEVSFRGRRPPGIKKIVLIKNTLLHFKNTKILTPGGQWHPSSTLKKAHRKPVQNHSNHNIITRNPKQQTLTLNLENQTLNPTTLQNPYKTLIKLWKKPTWNQHKTIRITI